jgi:hypothetical protein
MKLETRLADNIHVAYIPAYDAISCHRSSQLFSLENYLLRRIQNVRF